MIAVLAADCSSVRFAGAARDIKVVCNYPLEWRRPTRTMSACCVGSSILCRSGRVYSPLAAAQRRVRLHSGHECRIGKLKTSRRKRRLRRVPIRPRNSRVRALIPRRPWCCQKPGMIRQSRSHLSGPKVNRMKPGCRWFAGARPMDCRLRPERMTPPEYPDLQSTRRTGRSH